MTTNEYISALGVDLYPQTESALRTIWEQPRSKIILSGPSPSSKTTIGYLSMSILIHNLICSPSLLHGEIVIQGPTISYARRFRKSILDTFSLINFKYSESEDPIILSKTLSIRLASGRTNLLGINIAAYLTSEDPDTEEALCFQNRVLSKNGIIIYDTLEDRDTAFIADKKEESITNSLVYVYEGKGR